MINPIFDKHWSIDISRGPFRDVIPPFGHRRATSPCRFNKRVLPSEGCREMRGPPQCIATHISHKLGEREFGKNLEQWFCCQCHIWDCIISYRLLYWEQRNHWVQGHHHSPVAIFLQHFYTLVGSGLVADLQPSMPISTEQ